MACTAYNVTASLNFIEKRFSKSFIVNRPSSSSSSVVFIRASSQKLNFLQCSSVIRESNWFSGSKSTYSGGFKRFSENSEKYGFVRSASVEANIDSAFQASNGVMKAYTSPINGYKTQLQPGNLSFPVSSISAEFLNNEMIIFATLQLPNNITSVNQLWQDGPLMNGDVLGRHEMTADHVLSRKTLDLLSGQTTTSGPSTSTIGVRDSRMESRIKRRNIHGILSALTWGILMPIGAMMARYLKGIKSMGSAWFWVHVVTQSTAYVVGVAGWVIGLLLGSQSRGIQHDAHRTIGIILFSLGTLQVFAMGLRPKPDHKYRSYWNFYHHSTGYLVLILSVVNVYKGIGILEPEKKWKTAYTGVIIALGVLTVVLETYARMKKCAARKAQAFEVNGSAKALPV